MIVHHTDAEREYARLQAIHPILRSPHRREAGLKSAHQVRVPSRFAYLLVIFFFLRQTPYGRL